jgi:hypothetical protein
VDRHGAYQGNQIRVIEYGTESVRDGVTKLTTFVNTSRGLRSCVTANASRERELLEEALHTLSILRLVRVDFGVNSLEERVGNDGRGTVARTRDEEGIEIVLLNQTVHVNVGKRLTSVRAPMSKETRLDVLDLERFLQQRVLTEVEHTQAQVHAGMEVTVHLVDLILAERLVGHSSPGSAIGRETLCLGHRESCVGKRNWELRKTTRWNNKLLVSWSSQQLQLHLFLGTQRLMTASNVCQP